MGGGRWRTMALEISAFQRSIKGLAGNVACSFRASWRRGRDSNPRYGFPHTHFPGVRLRPLGHPSGIAPIKQARARRIAPDAAKAQAASRGQPEVAELAVDLHEDFIQMPLPLRIAAHMRDASLADLGGEHRAKPVPPKPTVSRLISIQRSASRSSTRSDSG